MSDKLDIKDLIPLDSVNDDDRIIMSDSTNAHSAAYLSIGELKETVIKPLVGESGTGGGGTSVPIIGTDDPTPATDENVFSALRSQEEFISKKTDDTVSGKLNFRDSVTFEDFVPGSSGASVYRDESGLWHVEADYMHVRNKLTAQEIEVQHTSHLGGKQILTPAGMVCSRVQEFETYWRCYFLAEDKDGNKVHNQWTINDLALAQTFNLAKQAGGPMGNHYFWRQVVNVSQVSEGNEHYIDLSKSVCAPGSDAPLEKDNIVQLGNTSNSDRQSAIIQASAGAEAPYIRIYEGISSFTMPKPKIDLNPKSSKITASEIYLESTGKDIGKTVTDISADIETMKQQNDNMWVLWFVDEKPTLNNYPALEWITDEERETHLQDIAMIDNRDGDNSHNGRAFRFNKSTEDGTFTWTEITDQYLLEALGIALEGRENAKEKRRNFIVQPTDADEYEVGDTWSNASWDGLYDDDNLVAISDKPKGEPFSIAHWKTTSKVNSAYIEVLKDSIRAIVSNAEDIERAANDAIERAKNAFDRADSAYKYAEDNDIRTSALAVTTEGITATVEKMEIDPITGAVRNIDSTGLVMESDFAGLFARKVELGEIDAVKQADIQLFITEDEAGDIVSNAQIRADQINLKGKVTFEDFDYDAQTKIDNKVDEATIIEGGYIKTSLIDVEKLKVGDDVLIKDGSVNAKLINTDELKVGDDVLIENGSINAKLINAEELKVGNDVLIKDGSINANLINANQLTVNHIEGATGSFDSIYGEQNGNRMRLSPALISFHGPDSIALFGPDTISGTAGGALIAPLSAHVTRKAEAYDGNAGLYLSVEGSTGLDDYNSQYTGNHALYVPKGDICGFRLRTRRITESTTLSVMDSVILVIREDIALTLPANPEDGQMYWIRNTGSSASFTLKANTGQKLNFGKSSSADSEYCGTGRMHTVVYDAVNKKWHGNWFNYHD